MSETIRQNWNLYKETIPITSLEYETLWNEWYEKYKINKNDELVKMLKNFIIGKDFQKSKNKILQDENTLILKKVKGERRKKIHEICNIIGLHHESKKTNDIYGKNLYIYKPKEWLWEFTEKNPYSKSEEYYEKKNKEALLRKEQKIITK